MTPEGGGLAIPGSRLPTTLEQPLPTLDLTLPPPVSTAASRISDSRREAGDARRAARTARRLARRRERGLLRLVGGRFSARGRAARALAAETRPTAIGPAPVDGSAPAGDTRPRGPAEGAVVARGSARAQAALNRGERRISRLTRAAERAGDAAADCRLRADQLARRPVRDPRAGAVPETDLRAETQHLHRVVRAEAAHGLTGHRRLGPVTRRLPAVAAAIDLAALLYFMSGVLDVDLERPLSIRGVLAVLLALLAVIPGFVWLTITGERLKGYRDSRGEVAWRALGALSWALLAGSAVLICTVAALMWLRVGQDAVDAGSAWPVWVGDAFAVFTTIGNLAVVAVHALDGTPHTERLDRAARVLRCRGRQAERLERRAARLERRRDLITRRVERRWQATLVRAESRLAAWCQVLDVAHALRGTGSEPGGTHEPRVDTRALDLARRHAGRE